MCCVPWPLSRLKYNKGIRQNHFKASGSHSLAHQLANICLRNAMTESLPRFRMAGGKECGILAGSAQIDLTAETKGTTPHETRERTPAATNAHGQDFNPDRAEAGTACT